MNNRFIEINQNEMVDIKLGDRIYKDCIFKSGNFTVKNIELRTDRYSNTNCAEATISKNMELTLSYKQMVIEKYIGESV